MKNTQHWPPGLPLHLELPETTLDFNLAVSVRRYPKRDAIIYYGSRLSYDELARHVYLVAGFLQQELEIFKGDCVGLYMQNCPQFIIAYYAILQLGAIVVPINAMNQADEVAHIIHDSGSKVIIYGKELESNLDSLNMHTHLHRIVVDYADYIETRTDLPLRGVFSGYSQGRASNATTWREVLEDKHFVVYSRVSPDDIAILPYTSGTTGRPKGCMLSHRNVMHTAICNMEWSRTGKDIVELAALPMFHMAGMQHGINTPIYAGGTIVIMTRWDKRCAAMLIERYRVTVWSAISTMVCDFINQPDLDKYDLSSLAVLVGGGAAMPKAVAEKIPGIFGIPYLEGYGLTETAAPTHINPPHRPKHQCLGIPISDTEAIVVDPETLEELPINEVGEILVHGPQVFMGYHNNPQATNVAFVEKDGKRFFRTGDLGYVDEEGYFFMKDRLKRMINVSGYKVWPAEVETMLYDHPAVLEACVVGVKDERSGEGVKAFVVTKPARTVDEATLIAWAKERMAAYKVPKTIAFCDQLPKNGAGKVLWRALQ